MGFCLKLFFFILSIILLLCFAPGIPPFHTFEVIHISPAQELTGSLTPNDYLNYGERLHEGFLKGPESIAVVNNQEVFVGLVNGDIVKIWGDHFQNTKVVYNSICVDQSGKQEICGRPLGLRYLSNDKLLVADAYLGIYTIDTKSGTKQSVVYPEVQIENKLPLVINDLDIDQEGNIYWSHSSTISNLTNSFLDVLVGPSGRLVKYHVKDQRNEVLLNKLYFANGVQLSPDESFVLVAECMARQVHRYWIKGPQQGRSEVFLSNLPGNPDNIRARPEGGYYVSLVECVHTNSFDLMAIMGRYPIVRRLLARILTGIKSTADLTENLFPNYYSRIISSSIFHLETISNLNGKISPFGKKAIVLEVDEDGNILGSMQGTSGLIKGVSETQRIGNTILFGSPFMNFLGKLDVSILQNVKQPVAMPGRKDEL